MSWNMDKNRPICPQICEQLSVMIAKGCYSPNDRLPSVRELALDAGVNPNTVQKSLEQLESLGYIHSVRGSGWFVNENTDAVNEGVAAVAMKKAADYLQIMRSLGLNDREALDTVERVIKEEKSNERNTSL